MWFRKTEYADAGQAVADSRGPEANSAIMGGGRLIKNHSLKAVEAGAGIYMITAFFVLGP